MDSINIVIGLLIFIVSLLYYLLQRTYSYWQRMGVPNIPPIFPYGNLNEIGKNAHACELFKDYYTEFKSKGPFIGLYFTFLKAVLLTDLDLIKNVMIKDANLFNERRVYSNEKDDPLSANLFAIDGIKWKNLRTKLTPTFTSGKMRFMFNTVTEIGDRLNNRLTEVISDTPEIEIKDYWARYSTDVIGSCAFGIECNTLYSKNAEFREMGRIVFEEPLHSPVVSMFLARIRGFSNFWGIKHFPKKSTDFFMNIVKDTINYREQTDHSCERKDFMNILMELKVDNKTASQKLNDPNKFTVEEIAAQAFIFFLAGFETSSSLLSFCSYELAINQDIQERAREECRQILTKYNGQLTYDGMMEMKYCDQVLNEALRKYPPLATLTRAASQDYPIEKTNFFIPKGSTVLIPVYAIQNDPDIYPMPDVFDPERFNAEQIRNRPSVAFLPFGEGPRNCIGLRFGMMQSRIGLATILLNYKFTLSSRMSIPLKLNKRQVIIASDQGIWLKMEKIQN